MSEAFILYGSPHSQFTYKVALMLRMSGALVRNSRPAGPARLGPEYRAGIAIGRIIDALQGQ